MESKQLFDVQEGGSFTADVREGDSFAADVREGGSFTADVKDEELEGVAGECGGKSNSRPPSFDPHAFCKHNFPNDGGGKCTCLDMRGAYQGTAGRCKYLWSSAAWNFPDGVTQYVCEYNLQGERL